MKNRFRLIVMLLTLLIPLAGFSVGLTEEQKISYLIKSVQTLKNAEFYRNGSYYDAAKAAEHLQMKLEKAGKRVKTAQEFIDLVGTKSYLTGEAYHIKFSDGRKVTTKAFFEQKLREVSGR